MLRWIIIAVAASVSVPVSGCGKGGGAAPASLADQDVVLVGENYCLGCALAQRGATAQCTVYGHRHALKVESALDAGGVPLGALTGETLHYLDNDKSAALVDSDDFDHRRVRVTGRLFVHERTIAVHEATAL